MSQSIDSERKKEMEGAARNLEEIMRRIAPYVRRPKEEPREHQNWVSSSGDAYPRSENKK